jgi:hypothetical protein
MLLPHVPQIDEPREDHRLARGALALQGTCGVGLERVEAAVEHGQVEAG